MAKKIQFKFFRLEKEKHLRKAGYLKKVLHILLEKEGEVLNTTLFDTSTVKFGLDLSKQLNKNLAKEMNFSQLLKYLTRSDIQDNERAVFTIELFDKIALPLTTIVFVLVGVPLAITPPRVRYNRGFLFSILIIFAYYVVSTIYIIRGSRFSASVPCCVAA